MKKLVAFQMDKETIEKLKLEGQKAERNFSSQMRFIVQEWLRKNENCSK